MSSEDNDQLPDIKEQGKNLAKFTFEVVKDVVSLNGTPVLSTEEEQQERLSICKMCESLRQNRCRQCGCYMNAKVKFTASQCPIQKW